MIPLTLYEYRARITDRPDAIYDGDSVRLDIDKGHSIMQGNVQHRLLGINALEMRGETLEAARAARDWLRWRLTGHLLWIRTVKPSVVLFPSEEKREKYGRYLVVIWTPDGVCTNEELVQRGLAVPYMTDIANTV